MDCYSAESEFIESLDFLSPPVKRIHNSREAFGSPYNTEANDVHLLRGLRNKFARRAPSSTRNTTKTVKTNAESSTSLILKKTSERQILEHYSIVSYTSLHPEQDTSSIHKSDRNQTNSEKPLIKVTVIPKTDQIQTAKLLRRRRYIPKRVQSTTSNHENSVQTKNVYLIVAGRRREKIYEIKTTGSAKFSTDHDSYSKDEEIPIKELSNFKHLIQSLNMDRKKRKDKNAPMDNSDAPQQTSFEWKGYPECENCICINDSNESPKKSRVRIFGQFGISEDDKYVLRYGATVNDKSVLSDVAQLTRDFSPVIATTSYGTTDGQSAQQKDSCVQADYNYDLDVEKPPVTDEVPSKESQGTQVNFNVQVATTKAQRTTFSDKKIQCSCCAVGNRSEHNTLKDCQSPLVIISVYPKPSPEDLIKSVPSPPENSRSQSPTRMNTYTSNQLLKADKSTKKSTEQTRRPYKSPPISRSPSPIKKSSRSKMPEDTPVKLQVNEKRSPDRQKALRAIKEKIQEKDRLKLEASTRKLPSKLNTTNATQVSKNLQNLTVSNTTQVSKKNQQLYTASDATQVSNRNHQLYTASNGTQVSAKRRQNYTMSNGTQYSDGPQSLSASIATKCEDTVDSLQDIAPVKHSKNVSASIKYPQNKSSPINHPQTTLVSNATQVPKIPQFFASNATQVSKSDPFTVSNATQVSKNNQNFIASRIAKNQETYTVPAQVFKNQQTSRLITKTKAETGTNTDHARAKKALVDTYTKKLTEQLNQKDFLPARYDNSKVTINIDADKEYYDVLFNQDKISTDLTIRKTLKDMGSQKCNEDVCLASLENLYVPDCALEKTVFKPGNKKSPCKFVANALYNNHSDDESPLEKHVSRLTIRDSIEISHRREDKSSHNNNNIKNTQTCFTAQFAENLPDETEFLAPIKHFIGDDCSICDPIERDKQIRELLGVNKTKPTFAKTKQAQYCENDDGIPYQCIYRQECKNSQVTEINFEFQKLCPCFKPHHSKDKASVSVQCRHKDCDKARTSLAKRNGKLVDATKCCVRPSGLPKGDKGGNLSSITKAGNNSLQGEDKKGNKRFDNNEKSAIYQQLILNRNIQVFLQVDQFSKQKPIILSRKQYDKVKKTIQKTISMKKSSHEKRKFALPGMRDRSQVSVGEVRTKKPKDSKLHHEKEAQTDAILCCKDYCKKDKSKSVWRGRSHRQKSNVKGDSSDRSRDQSEDRSISKSKKTKKDKKNKGHHIELAEHNKRHAGDNVEMNASDQNSGNSSLDSDVEEQSKQKYNEPKGRRAADQVRCPSKRRTERLAEPNVGKNAMGKAVDSPERLPVQEEESPDLCSILTPSPCSGKYSNRDAEQNLAPYRAREEPNEEEEQKETEVKTFVLYNSENIKDNSKDAKETDYDGHNRKTMSSVEIRYASVAYMKQVAYSSTDVGALSDSSIAHVNSFHTIFRGHRKSATPNLGTSAYSLYSEDGCNSENKSAKYIMEPRDSKPKKPFLRRLMSCLVMRSTRDSELKLPTGPAPEPPSVNSSIDSYHISTSLGAVEVSSSIYDTSASFYSNHTILPVNSKIKRGFFSSVRGFLTNRKS